MQNRIERIGGYMIIGGACTLAAIFLTVLAMGHWPAFLSPIQSLFDFLGDWLGSWAIIVEGWIFIGPGLLLKWFGSRAKPHAA